MATCADLVISLFHQPPQLKRHGASLKLIIPDENQHLKTIKYFVFNCYSFAFQ